MTHFPNHTGPVRIGIGGPVGSGKTALMDRLCKAMRETYDIAAITNDIYTREDAEFLTRSGRWSRNGSSASRPAVALIRQFAKTPPSTWRRSTIWWRSSRGWKCC